jgi:hypothetical protein
VAAHDVAGMWAVKTSFEPLADIDGEDAEYQSALRSVAMSNRRRSLKGAWKAMHLEDDAGGVVLQVVELVSD